MEYESHGGVVKALGGLTTRGHGGSVNITDTKTQGPHRSAMRHVVYHRNFRFWVKSQALFTLVQYLRVIFFKGKVRQFDVYAFTLPYFFFIPVSPFLFLASILSLLCGKTFFFSSD